MTNQIRELWYGYDYGFYYILVIINQSNGPIWNIVCKNNKKNN